VKQINRGQPGAKQYLAQKITIPAIQESPSCRCDCRNFGDHMHTAQNLKLDTQLPPYHHQCFSSGNSSSISSSTSPRSRPSQLRPIQSSDLQTPKSPTSPTHRSTNRFPHRLHLYSLCTNAIKPRIPKSAYFNCGKSFMAIVTYPIQGTYPRTLPTICFRSSQLKPLYSWMSSSSLLSPFVRRD